MAFILKTTQEATHGLGPLSDVIQGVCEGEWAPRDEALKSNEALIKPRRGGGQKSQGAEAPGAGQARPATRSVVRGLSPSRVPSCRCFLICKMSPSVPVTSKLPFMPAPRGRLGLRP